LRGYSASVHPAAIASDAYSFQVGVPSSIVVSYVSRQISASGYPSTLLHCMQSGSLQPKNAILTAKIKILTIQRISFPKNRKPLVK